MLTIFFSKYLKVRSVFNILNNKEKRLNDGSDFIVVTKR